MRYDENVRVHQGMRMQKAVLLPVGIVGYYGIVGLFGHCRLWFCGAAADGVDVVAYILAGTWGGESWATKLCEMAGRGDRLRVASIRILKFEIYHHQYRYYC